MSLRSNVDTSIMTSVLHSRTHGSLRPKAGFISLVQLFLTWLCQVAFSHAHPFASSSEWTLSVRKPHKNKGPTDAELWIYFGTAIALVLIGGAFAGLTIALMGQDEIHLQVISTSGEGRERKNATKVLNLLKKGKHWVLVTLLVGNVITNETLPIVLDRSIGGGYAAAISSTVLVIVFGEIVPQSVCVRFGLPIGAWMAPFVLVLMWIFAPITWPIAKLLDWILGENHGTTYKKAGLKTLVTLHKTMGGAPGERLNQDEVSIISGVLDLKAKAVGTIMTPMNDVFILPADAVLDEDLMAEIMQEGYSRIPIHDPSNRTDFVGMLLVKMLITYDPEDCAKVTDFALATLPETRPETSCLDIINFFQEGKSHMVLVSDFPGEPDGALGVVTLEDVIEELIGEEIIDESDVYIDVHKAIRRMTPAPTHRHRPARISKGEIVTDHPTNRATADELLLDMDSQVKENGEIPAPDEPPKRNSSASFEYARPPTPRSHTFRMRRTSSQGSAQDFKTVQMRPNTTEWKEQLSKLGPSNAASRPRQTRVNTVKVKPAVGTIPEHKTSLGVSDFSDVETPRVSLSAQSGERPDVLRSGHAAKDGVKAVQAEQTKSDRSSLRPPTFSGTKTKGVQADASSRNSSRPGKKMISRTGSHDTLGSMRSDSGHSKSSSSKPAPPARSGSITEQIIESSGGVRKMVLGMTSSSEDEEDDHSDAEKGSPFPSRSSSVRHLPTRYIEEDDELSPSAQPDPEKQTSKATKKKRRKKSKTENKEQKTRDSTDENNDEQTPLLFE